MSTAIIALIDAEIARLKEVRALIAANRKGPGRPPSYAATAPAKQAKPPKKAKRKMSPEGRARIVAAVKARWAAQKKAAK